MRKRIHFDADHPVKEEPMTQYKNSVVRYASLWTFVAVVMFVSSVTAQVPKSEKEIPVYPGAVRDADKESAAKSEMAGEPDQSIRSGVLKVYVTSASAEEVFKFYIQKIRAKEGALEIDPRGLERGAVSQPVYEISYYTDQDFGDTDGYSGAWKKESLQKNRKPYTPGKWITGGYLNWYKKEVNGDLTTFYINIDDESFDDPSKRNKTATSIRISIGTEKSEQARREENEAQMDQKVEDLSKSLKSRPPSAKDLGAPLYPGATFNAEATAGMSAGNDNAYYVFLTTDSPSKVVAFYEQQLKIKAAGEGGRYMIPLKGKLPMPDEGISIEPNTMFGGSAKTVITIMKMVGKNEE